MPRLDDTREALLDSGDQVQKHAKHAWDDFSDFALRDNVLEIGVGLIIASAFTAVVNSFVSDIILPPISLLPFLNKNLDEKFAVLKHGSSKHASYNTPKQALDDGAVVMVYGYDPEPRTFAFLSKVLSFFVVAMTLFAVARFYGWASGDSIIKQQVKCKYCRKRIGQKAKRCVNCTSWQDGREDK
ncbi:hypothetical protein MMC25_001191 [Agyrium rufum]|nr:hypothetical protein [Agyrium rufum]